MLALGGQLFQGRNRHCFFPPNVGVAVEATMRHRQGGVQQEHSLLGPRLQGRFRHQPRRVVVTHLFKDVLERRRHFGRFRHGKGSAYSLTLIGVRVLAENDHANFVEGAVLESTEYVLLDRVDALAFLSQGSYLLQHFAALSASEYRHPATVALHPNLPSALHWIPSGTMRFLK